MNIYKDMKEVNYSTVWRKAGKDKSLFVSQYIHHTFPTLRKHPKIKKVLDVACGNGLGVTLPLLQKGYEVHCFDNNAQALKALKNNTKGHVVMAKKADMYKKFPYKDQEFDATFCFQAIYHGRIEQIMHTLSEIKRIIKKGGLFFGTFIDYSLVGFDSKKKLNYLKVIDIHSQKLTKAYLRLDKSQPRLFYYTSRHFHFDQPNYFFDMNELRVLLKQYFTNVTIKTVKKDKLTQFLLAQGKK